MIWVSVGNASRPQGRQRPPPPAQSESLHEKGSPQGAFFAFAGNEETRQAAYFSAAARFASILVSTSTATTMSTRPRPREIHGVLVIPAMM